MNRLWWAQGALASVVVGALLGTTSAFASTTPPPNIIRNPGAEAAAGSADGSTVAVPDWRVPKGGTFTAVQYGASGFPDATSPGPKARGSNFFAGGVTMVATAQQTDSVAKYAAVIASGATFTLQGWLGGFADQSDHATLTVTWKSSNGASLGTAKIGGVTPATRKDVTGLQHRLTSGTVPVGTATAVLTMRMTRTEGSYDDGYADDLSLTIVGSAG